MNYFLNSKNIIIKLNIILCFWLFLMQGAFAQTYTSADVPKTLDETNAATATSTLSVGDDISIADINVSLDIGHTYISDLEIRLTSPDNTIVTLYDNSCSNESNIVMTFDDEGATTFPCPPVDGGSYQPSTSLSNFDNKSATGTWTLTIIDGFSGDGGALNSWSISIVPACSVTAPTLSKN